jgi:hypothetical protein
MFLVDGPGFRRRLAVSAAHCHVSDNNASVGRIGRFRRPGATLCGPIGPFFCPRSVSDPRKKLNRALYSGGQTGLMWMTEQEIARPLRMLIVILLNSYVRLVLDTKNRWQEIQNIKRPLVSEGYHNGITLILIPCLFQILRHSTKFKSIAL